MTFYIKQTQIKDKINHPYILMQRNINRVIAFIFAFNLFLNSAFAAERYLICNGISDAKEVRDRIEKQWRNNWNEIFFLNGEKLYYESRKEIKNCKFESYRIKCLKPSEVSLVAPSLHSSEELEINRIDGSIEILRIFHEYKSKNEGNLLRVTNYTISGKCEASHSLKF